MTRQVTRDHQARLVICCVTFLATQATVAGVWLHAHGFPGGAGLTLIILNTAISGLIGFLGGRMMPPVKDILLETPPTITMPK
jgi:hypothetical protein